MENVTHGIYGFFNDKYYKVQDDQFIVIPENVDYSHNALSSVITDSINQADIDVYTYHTDLTTDNNASRVAYMKEYLIDQGITTIDTLNRHDYIIGIDYTLYNNKGEIIKQGSSTVKAKHCSALIASEIDDTNTPLYRKAFVFDGRIEIDVPVISRYGIKDAYSQYPYTLKISNVIVSGTVGDSLINIESNTQRETTDVHNGSSANYLNIQHPTLCMNNYAEHFVTNAQVGTTIIDSVVAPATLEVEEAYELISLAGVKLDSAIKLDHKLNNIVVNLEMLVDNYNMVYDIKDIETLLENIKDSSQPDKDIIDTPVEE